MKFEAAIPRSEIHSDFSDAAYATVDIVADKLFSEILLEYVKTPTGTRSTLVTALPAEIELPERENELGLEIMVLSGVLTDGNSEYPAGYYLRFPPQTHLPLHSVRSACVFLKYNQFDPGDSGTRAINTCDKDMWIDAADSTRQVCPLHGFGSSSTMLLRWPEASSLKPALNPPGEEILVWHGMLHDGARAYPAGSWLRTPIDDWRRWQASAGTCIYYKSGHFPHQPASDRANR